MNHTELSVNTVYSCTVHPLYYVHCSVGDGVCVSVWGETENVGGGVNHPLCQASIAGHKLREVLADQRPFVASHILQAGRRILRPRALHIENVHQVPGPR